MTRLIFLASCFLGVIAVLGAQSVEFKLVDSKGAPVSDAVVSLFALGAASQPARPSATPGSVEIVQQGKEFSPFVSAIAVGTTVKFPNHDSVEHHIYSLSPARKFELPLYRPGSEKTVTFNQPGLVVLGCNIHDWMNAYVVVLATPWFAKTTENGTATLTGLPAGRYRAEVWHWRLAKTETRELTVGAGASTAAAFTLGLKADRRIRRPPAASGGGYK